MPLPEGCRWKEPLPKQPFQMEAKDLTVRRFCQLPQVRLDPHQSLSVYDLSSAHAHACILPDAGEGLEDKGWMHGTWWRHGKTGVPEGTSCTCHIPGPQEWPRSRWEGTRMEWRPGENGTKGKAEPLPLLEGEETKGGYYPNRRLPEAARGSPQINRSQQFAPGRDAKRAEGRRAQAEPAARARRHLPARCRSVLHAPFLLALARARSRDTQGEEEGGPGPLLCPAPGSLSSSRS